MRLKIGFIILLCFMGTDSYSQQIQKYYYHNKKKLDLISITDPTLNLMINKISHLKTAQDQTIKSIILYGKKEKRSLLQIVLNKPILYQYKIDFSDLKEGYYGFHLSGPHYNQTFKILISRYKLNTKIINQNSIHYVIDTQYGIPIKQFDLFLLENTEMIKQKQTENYFYTLNLEEKDYTFIHSYSNHFDINSLKKEQIVIKNPEPFIEIILPKKYYYIGESLFYTILLKEKMNYALYNVPIPEITITLYDSHNQLIKSKTINNIISGFITDYTTIDDLFQEGHYFLQVQWKDHIQKKEIIVLKKITTEYDIQVHTDKKIYYQNENIYLSVQVAHKDGLPLIQGDVFCDVYYKPLDSNQNFIYLYSLKKKIFRKKIPFIITAKSLTKNQNIQLKFVIKARSHNGLVEGNYTSVKKLYSNYILFNLTENKIFEIENPITLRYGYKSLLEKSYIKKILLRVYHISDMNKLNGEQIKVIELLKNKKEVSFEVNKTGYYRALFILTDNDNHDIIQEYYFWVLSYTYGVDIPKNLNKIYLIQNKQEYQYSDIGKLLILFPQKDVWYSLYFEKEKIYYHSMNFTEKRFAIFDFPINEDYSPEINAKVITYDQEKEHQESIPINVPFLNKFIKINTLVSNKSHYTNENKAHIETVNYWNHNLNGQVITYLLNKNFMELYNQYPFVYFQTFYNQPHPLQTVVPMESVTHTNQSPLPLMYSDYLINSLSSYSLLNISKLLPVVKSFSFPSLGNWNLTLLGFTEDAKFGLTVLELLYKHDFEYNYKISPYLNVKDQSFLQFSIKNNKEINVKAKFNFNIINRKLQSQKEQFFTIAPQEQKKVYLVFKPQYSGMSKLDWEIVTPYENYKKTNYIKIIPSPEIPASIKSSIKISKKWFLLKYFSYGEEYYNKLRWTGSSFYPGDDILIQYKIKAKELINNIRIIDFLPAGFELIENIANYHLYKIKPFNNYALLKKENNITIHIPQMEKGSYYIYYILKARFPGRFYLPGYYATQGDHIIFSREESKYIRIKE